MNSADHEGLLMVRWPGSRTSAGLQDTPWSRGGGKSRTNPQTPSTL
jgi:hypothetical protein